MPDTIRFRVNGRSVMVSAPPMKRLLDVLREDLGLTGTKYGCGEGECGACTVLMDGVPVNSCLILACQARDSSVETVESCDPDALAPLHEGGATQCGACTPGVVMTAGWIRDHPQLLETHSIRELMAGNLCRCTGYDGIIESIEVAMERRVAFGGEHDGGGGS